MKAFLIKYSSLAWLMGLGFANAVACGSQLYKVSLDDDYDHRVAIKANPSVADPASPVYGIHATEGWKKLPIPYQFSAGLTAENRAQLFNAMRTWETAVGIQLFALQGLHEKLGDDFEDLYSSLNDEINGYYFDNNWEKTQKSERVLATAIWTNMPGRASIKTADLRFNTSGYLIGDSLVLKATDDKEVVDMQSLALHELGHLLGLAHVTEDVDVYSIMNPSLFIGEGLTTRQLSLGDIRRIQSIYGCAGDACEIDHVLRQLTELEKGPLADPLNNMMTH
jgi:hypothetical protein